MELLQRVADIEKREKDLEAREKKEAEEKKRRRNDGRLIWERSIRLRLEATMEQNSGSKGSESASSTSWRWV